MSKILEAPQNKQWLWLWLLQPALINTTTQKSSLGLKSLSQNTAIYIIINIV